MNKKALTVILILVGFIVLTIGGTSLLRSEKVTTIQGEVELTESKISSKLPGRIENMKVKEGDKVSKNDFLYAITTPEIDAKMAQVQAVRQAAKAQKQKADVGARKQTIGSAKNLWNKAEAGREFAQKSYNRVENLYKEGVVPQQKLDEVKAQLEVANANANAAKLQYEMAVEGAQKEDKMAATALVAQADGAVKEVESYLAEASQYAPFDGEISKIIAQNGELVGTGLPVITVVDIENPWFVFNVKETLLPKMKQGDKVMVYVPALDKDIEIEITSIAVQADYATWTATRSIGTFDVRTFEVKAYPTQKTSELRAGMTCVFTLDK